MYWTSIS